MGAPFSNHKTFVGNFIDPLGFLGGRKGFLGIGEDKNKSGDKSGDATPAAPSVTSDVSTDDDPERLKRIGRAQLITSSQRGVLSEAETSSRKLFGV